MSLNTANRSIGQKEEMNNVNVNICEIKSSLCNSTKITLHLYLLYIVLNEEFDKIDLRERLIHFE